MGCDEENENITQFERNKYFYGKLMTVRDFETEQNYFNGKRQLINRFIHGLGIVCGLEVADSTSKINPPKKDNGNWMIYINPGVALDCCGREIVVDQGDFFEVNKPFKSGINDKNYLYLRYAECGKESVPAPVKSSGCDEDCCVNRVKEIFELEWGDSPDEGMNTISGTIKVSGVIPSSSSIKVEVAVVEVWKDGVLKAVTGADVNGDYKFLLKPDSYDIKAFSGGYNGVLKNVDLNSGSLTGKNITLQDKNTTNSTLAKERVQSYYEESLAECPQCGDAKVLLAVIKGNLEMDETETEKYRAVVYSNPLLYELLNRHMVDFNNPHQVVAEQTGALVSIDGLSNPGGDVDLLDENAIKIRHGTSNNPPQIIISENHSIITTGNPHKVTAKDTGALVSIKGKQNPGGNIDLKSENAITIKPSTLVHVGEDPFITIGETHSARADNPHKVTAKQTGALVGLSTVSDNDVITISGDSEGYITVKPGENISIATTPNSIIISSTATNGISPSYIYGRVLRDAAISLRAMMATFSHIEGIKFVPDSLDAVFQLGTWPDNLLNKESFSLNVKGSYLFTIKDLKKNIADITTKDIASYFTTRGLNWDTTAKLSLIDGAIIIDLPSIQYVMCNLSNNPYIYYVFYSVNANLGAFYYGLRNVALLNSMEKVELYGLNELSNNLPNLTSVLDQIGDRNKITDEIALKIAGAIDLFYYIISFLEPIEHASGPYKLSKHGKKYLSKRPEEENEFIQNPETNAVLKEIQENEYIKIDEIAKNTGIDLKSVRSTINSLKDLKIISGTTRKGYKLELK